MTRLVFDGAAGTPARVAGEGRVRVMLADDHPLVRDGMARAVRQRPELELVGEAGDGEAALELLRTLRPDVAVLDVRMPELDGLQVLQAAVHEGLPTRVLFLSAFADGPTVHAAVAAGATGFLTKDAQREAICDAIVAVAAGQTVLVPELQAALNAQLRARAEQAAGPTLSAREHEVLALIAQGRTMGQVAEQLVVAPSTVKSHLQSAYDKLGASTQASAVAEAMRRGLLS